MSDHGRFRDKDEKRIKDPSKKKEKIFIKVEELECEECGSRIYKDAEGNPEICPSCGYDPLEDEEDVT